MIARSSIDRVVTSSFLRKRGPRDFGRCPWAPTFAGATIGEDAEGR